MTHSVDSGSLALSKPFKIDVHTHILPERWPDLRERYGYGGWVRLDHHKPCCARMLVDDKFFREIESNCWDPKVRMHECEHHGVDVQVLSTVPVMFSYWAQPHHALDLSMILNDHIAGVVTDYPDRFIGLGTVPMQHSKFAVQELERCITDLGMAGIQIGSHVNDWNLEDKELWPIYEAAESLRAAIFVHPWNMMGQDKMKKYWLPWLVGMPAETSRAICSMIFGGVLRQFPKLKVCFAHGGGSFPITFGRVAHGFEVRPDLCAVDNDEHPSAYLDRIYFDSLVHDPAALNYLIQFLGEDRIMLGTDYPFPLGELEPGKAIMSAVSDPIVQNKLLYGNALDWLQLPQNQLDHIYSGHKHFKG